jgi:hypothetical protein
VEVKVDIDDLFTPSARIQGRARRAPLIEYIRDLRPSDLALLSIERHTTAPTIQRLRDSHHALARCLATGAHPAEASLVTGYSLSRISILKADPSFQELLAFYREKTDEVFVDVNARMSALSLEAIAELQERLDDDPGAFSRVELLEIAKVFADRTGYGPSSKSLNVNMNVDLATKLERARQRALEHQAQEDIRAPPTHTPTHPHTHNQAGGEEC